MRKRLSVSRSGRSCFATREDARPPSVPFWRTRVLANRSRSGCFAGLAALFVLAAAGTVSAGTVLVDVDAAKLPTGPAPVVHNAGSLGGDWIAGGQQSIVVETFWGRRAVSFTGSDWLVSTFAAPPGVTGSNAYTVAVWALNPSIAAEECLVMWAQRGTEPRAAQLNYGQSKDFGAVTHWGKPDMGFDGGVPAFNVWHHIAVTYTGGSNGAERVYVDGTLNAMETKTLNLWPAGRIYVGSAGGERGFSGALASVQMFARALTGGEVAALAAKPGSPADAAALVNLNTADLPDGRLAAWPNRGTLGGTFTRASVPQVAVVVGIPALQFEGSQTLVAAESLPAALRGAQPFTVEALVLNPEVGRAETVASFGATNGLSANFNFGRNLSAGAFSAGPDAGVAFEVRPPSNAWRHLAWVYSGAPGGPVTVYDEGEKAGEGRVPFALGSEARLVIGAGGWDGTWNRFSGALARLRVTDAAISQYELRRECGLTAAFNPAPRNEAMVGELQTRLSWERGNEDVVRYRVYFSDDRAAVEQRDGAAVKAEPATVVCGPLALRVGQHYFWRVDQLDAAGSNAWPGPVWSFQVDAGLAAQPQPRDRTANTPTGLRELQWQPGRFATRQHVCFGDSERAVETVSAAESESLGAGASSWTVPAALRPGCRYYGRVDSENGDQPATTGAVWAFRTQDAPVSNEVTFFVVTDTHYASDPMSYVGARKTIGVMNWLPGETWPAELGGGLVRTPRGVLHTGDMIDNGGAPDAAAVWRVFTSDFGVAGEGRLCYPVFECVGNHDAGDGFPPQEGVKARNLQRHGLTGVSSNGLHYSWDWGRAHFVCVNKYAGAGRDPGRPFNQDWNDPTHSLEFLAADLARNVGTSGRPVIVYQHYGWDGFSAGWGWWNEHDRTNAWNAIKDYNIVAYLHGHTHAATFMKWDGLDFYKEGQRMPDKGLDIIGCGSGSRGPEGPGDFMVFQLDDKELRVAERNGKEWGIRLRIPIQTGSLAERLAGGK